MPLRAMVPPGGYRSLRSRLTFGRRALGRPRFISAIGTEGQPGKAGRNLVDGYAIWAIPFAGPVDGAEQHQSCRVKIDILRDITGFRCVDDDIPPDIFIAPAFQAACLSKFSRQERKCANARGRIVAVFER